VVHFTRTKTSQENYRQIGAALHCGITEAQAHALQEQLQQDKKPVFMWECVTGIRSPKKRSPERDRIERLVILPLSPIFH